MTEAIDWSGDLEAFHPDGLVVPVSNAPFGEGTWPDKDGQYHIDEADVPMFFNGDGSHWGGSPWRIRNRKPSEGVTPELVGAQIVRLRVARNWAHLISIVEQGCGGTQSFKEMAESAMRQAKELTELLDAILAECEAATKPPADPLEALNASVAKHTHWHGVGEKIIADLAKQGLTITKADAS